ncbi:N-acetylmuramoyl-L-alanine amidase [Bacteroidia bacterium]|nr:N-acetylmuramoyl-L-alanine amidase [Bacteroidia bacterium]
MGKPYKLLSFCLALFFAFSVQANIKDNTFVLVIDPGHGGKDAGAVGRKGKEKDINLAVSTLLGKYITAKHPDVKLIYTRNRDVFIGLNERADIANKANANLFISIHTNAVERRNSRIKGCEVFTFGLSRSNENLEVAKRENAVILLEDNYKQKYENFDPHSSESYIIFEFMQNKFVEQSVNFASIIQKQLVRTANRQNRGVKQAEYLVLRKSSMPRVLVELDFISNPEAESYLLSRKGQETLALAISNAFTEYKKDFDRKSNGSSPVGKNQKIAQSNIIPIEADDIVEEPANVIIEADNDMRTDIVNNHGKNDIKPSPNSNAKSNTIYKVQILVSPKKLPEKSRELKGYKADYYIEKNMYKYTYGESSDWKEINRIQKKIAKDFKDAFIVRFKDGVKAPNK